ncbi:MAG: hypothetical protein M3498_16250, partial [Deinococcota bacterium]|nr:hypothetical protein [Deinococcota bacterium]
LERARGGARDFDLHAGRLVIFSDHHRGARNGADDFEAAEETYRAALDWYFERGYTLVVLGDAEELWQERPADVVEAYGDCLELEARFHQTGRYLRVWGNHDDDWQDEKAVTEHLRPRYGEPPLETHESLLFTVKDGKRELGGLFLVHGHQGSLKSDRLSGVARLAVRHLYRPFQRLTGLSLDTPSKNRHLRHQQNETLHAWAAVQGGLLLIAGHTHRPVFESRSGSGHLSEQLKAAKAKLEEASADTRPRQRPHQRLHQRLHQKVAELEEELEDVREEEEREGSGREVKPCYFNTGCCCFPGGDITGVELAGGEIRLVHWPDEEGRPRPMVLEKDALGAVFDRC